MPKTKKPKPGTWGSLKRSSSAQFSSKAPHPSKTGDLGRVVDMMKRDHQMFRLPGEAASRDHEELHVDGERRSRRQKP